MLSDPRIIVFLFQITAKSFLHPGQTARSQHYHKASAFIANSKWILLEKDYEKKAE